jgi:hypothetical protein
MRTAFKIYIGLLVFLILAAAPLMFAVGTTAAWLIVNFGTLAVIFGFLGYAVVDSRGRWPNDSWFARLGKIVTFTR